MNIAHIHAIAISSPNSIIFFIINIYLFLYTHLPLPLQRLDNGDPIPGIIEDARNLLVQNAVIEEASREQAAAIAAAQLGDD